MANGSNMGKNDKNPAAKYNKLSEKLRQVTPDELQCSMFCGGKKCKYESATCWDPKETAINGLYSHWITDKILACARPNTLNIEKYNIIQQFQNHGIKSIFNVQSRGEHSSCTPQLHKSGFSYNPQVFMKQNIFFYNFAIKDYGVASPDFLLDMVKVMAFALVEGKVAVHCHAGLGRTGVLIASYLIYSLRVNANEAIRYIRLKRPNSIQTRGQITCVQTFAQYILPKFITFALSTNKLEDQFTLDEFLQRQAKILHGYEARIVKNIPKIIFVIGKRLLQLCYHKNQGDFSLMNDEVEDTDKEMNMVSSDNINPRIENKKLGLLRQKQVSSTSLSFDDDGVGEAGGKVWPEVDDPDMDADTLSLSDFNDENLNSLTLNPCYTELQALHSSQTSSLTTVVTVSSEDIVSIFHKWDANNPLSPELKEKLQRYQEDLNTHPVTWNLLTKENNTQLLVYLFCTWFQHLKEPVISECEYQLICKEEITGKNVMNIFRSLRKNAQSSINYLLRLSNQFQPISEKSKACLIKKLSHLLHPKSKENKLDKFCLELLPCLMSGNEEKLSSQVNHSLSLR